jgi:hypothetical protein
MLSYRSELEGGPVMEKGGGPVDPTGGLLPPVQAVEWVRAVPPEPDYGCQLNLSYYIYRKDKNLTCSYPIYWS